jgi:hypothetical protein
MLEHTLNPVKGWPSPNAVDFRAKISSSVAFTLFSGRAVHLNSAGEYITGCDPAAHPGGTGMTMFLFQNSDDPDVVNEGGDPETETDVWVPVSPTGRAMALPAKGAYEMETTEYDTTGSYPPGTSLTADNDDADVDAGGILAAGTTYTDHICGVVSRGVVDSGYGRRGANTGQALAFWPVWLPPAP